MTDLKSKSRFVLHAVFVLVALVILIDFAVPGRILNDEIVDLQQTRQQYYNAGGNYHYTYKIITNEHKFLVSKEFAQRNLEHEEIEYSVSPVFKEVNWYRLPDVGSKSFHSLRLASGLILPLLVIISIVVTQRYQKNLGTLPFILRTLLLADLILLMT